MAPSGATRRLDGTNERRENDVGGVVAVASGKEGLHSPFGEFNSLLRSFSSTGEGAILVDIEEAVAEGGGGRNNLSNHVNVLVTELAEGTYDIHIRRCIFTTSLDMGLDRLLNFLDISRNKFSLNSSEAPRRG